MSSSSSDERSPKRQRRSYSPASPPATEETKNSIAHQPHTPPPSVRMSPSWTSQSQTLPGLGMQQGGNGNGSGSVTFPTPPSTAGLQSQMMARGGSSESGGAESGQQSPMTTSPEVETVAKTDGDSGDAEMTDRPQAATSAEEGDVSMAEDSEHRRSDHERLEGDTKAEDTSTIATQAADAGPKVLYKLSTEPTLPSQPLPTDDILKLYDLQRIQASVARRDPVTGEKINTIRKSYAGKLKDLSLEGKNKPVKNQRELWGLVDPGWSFDANDGSGRTLWEQSKEEALLGVHDSNQMFSMLDRALNMRPGHLPKGEYERWKDVINLDDTTTTTATATGKPSVAATPAFTPNTAASNFLSKTAPMRNSAPSSPRNMLPARPERTGKKRRYVESSFEGYDEDGYSTGGVDDTGRRGSGGKRQKRKDFSPTATSPPFSSNTSGGSMVGVRSS